MIVRPSRPCNALPNGNRLFSTTVPDTAADETVLDTQSIPVPVVSVRHHHSFAQIIIRWNCLRGMKSLLRPTQKYLAHGAVRGSDQALQKCRMPTVMSEKKWTSQSDKMMTCTFFYTRPALHCWKAVFPLWRTTAQELGRGCEWHLWSSKTWKWHIACTAQSCSRFFFRKWLTLGANIKRITNQPKNGKLFVGQDVSPSLGVSTLASSAREQVSREQM